MNHSTGTSYTNCLNRQETIGLVVNHIAYYVCDDNSRYGIPDRAGIIHGPVEFFTDEERSRKAMLRSLIDIPVNSNHAGDPLGVWRHGEVILCEQHIADALIEYSNAVADSTYSVWNTHAPQVWGPECLTLEYWYDRIMRPHSVVSTSYEGMMYCDHEVYFDLHDTTMAALAGGQIVYNGFVQ